MSATFYEALGAERAPLAFGDAITHHNDYGAYELARCVVHGIRELSLPVARYLLPEIAPFDPSHPDKPEAFALSP